MNIWKKIAITFGAIIVGVPIAIVSLFFYATNDMCRNEIYSEILSPDREHKVMVFHRDCGATTGFNTQVSIIDSSVELNNVSGNIYIIDGHPRDVSLDITWLSNTDLKIEKNLNVFEYKTELTWGFLNKIKITYGTGGS